MENHFQLSLKKPEAIREKIAKYAKNTISKSKIQYKWQEDGSHTLVSLASGTLDRVRTVLGSDK